MDKRLVALSKFLSLALRHRPEEIGIVLDRDGWTDVATLLARAQAAGTPLTQEALAAIVADNDKKTFHAIRRRKPHPRRPGTFDRVGGHDPRGGDAAGPPLSRNGGSFPGSHSPRRLVAARAALCTLVGRRGHGPDGRRAPWTAVGIGHRRGGYAYRRPYLPLRRQRSLADRRRAATFSLPIAGAFYGSFKPLC